MKVMYEVIPYLNQVIKILVIKETTHTVTIKTMSRIIKQHKHTNYSHIFNTFKKAKEYLLDYKNNQIQQTQLQLEKYQKELEQIKNIKE